MLHELGHVLGLLHAPDDAPPSIMKQQFFNSDKRTVTTYDKKSIQKLYGGERTPPLMPLRSTTHGKRGQQHSYREMKAPEDHEEEKIITRIIEIGIDGKCQHHQDKEKK